MTRSEEPSVEELPGIGHGPQQPHPLVDDKGGPDRGSHRRFTPMSAALEWSVSVPRIVAGFLDPATGCQPGAF